MKTTTQVMYVPAYRPGGDHRNGILHSKGVNCLPVTEPVGADAANSTSGNNSKTQVERMHTKFDLYTCDSLGKN